MLVFLYLKVGSSWSFSYFKKNNIFLCILLLLGILIRQYILGECKHFLALSVKRGKNTDIAEGVECKKKPRKNLPSQFFLLSKLFPLRNSRWKWKVWCKFLRQILLLHCAYTSLIRFHRIHMCVASCIACIPRCFMRYAIFPWNSSNKFIQECFDETMWKNML